MWRPSWSCDPDAANILLFPLPKDLASKGRGVSEKKMFEIVDGWADGWATDGRRTMGIL